MKSLIDRINEALQKQPEINSKDVAYDVNGKEWIVDCFCSVHGNDATGIKSLDELLKKYDANDVVKEEIKTTRAKKDDMIVGCHAKDDEKELIAAIWGKYMSYDNKK